LLSDRLNGTAAKKTGVAVTVGLVVSAAVAAIAIVGYIDQTSKLTEKSEIIIQQENEILSQQAIVGEQRAEIQAKTDEMARIQGEIGSLSAELDESELELQQESGRAMLLESEISQLQNEAALLQAEISALQSKIQLDEQRISELETRQIPVTDRVIISHYGVGVDQDNQGTVFPIRVEIVSPGTGVLSVDINNVQYEPGFQTAVRAAAAAAAGYSGESISDKDIIVRFAYEDSMFGGQPVKVDGTSAGAVIAAMMSAGLAEKQIKSTVMVTGSISEDGTVGRIGSLEEKLAAADIFGAETMLVPKSQEFESDAMQVIGVSNIDELMQQLTS
jgi:predicted ATP-dependent protease